MPATVSQLVAVFVLAHVVAVGVLTILALGGVL